MKKFILNVTKGQKNTAGDKAKKDITSILSLNEYYPVNISFYNNKLMKLFTSKYVIKNVLKNIAPGDILVIQYPIYSNYLLNILLDECIKKNIYTIGLLHDVESLRAFKNDNKRIRDEISLFDKFSAIVSHNSKMTRWLKEKNIKTKISELNIFDYLNECQLVDSSKSKEIVFAGNLEKSKFLDKWNLPLNVKLFGINPSSGYSSYISYNGVKDPNDLPNFLDGSFGLIWDGTSLNTNDGVFGEYTKYNNPHKASLYLSSGLPVIVWKEAAIAEFIEKNNLGLIVSNLEELPKKINNMPQEEYNEIKNNVLNISKKLRKGEYTLSAINRAVSMIKSYIKN